LQFAEDIGQLDDALGDFFNFALALRDGGFVGIVQETLLRGLLECRLREGALTSPTRDANDILRFFAIVSSPLLKPPVCCDSRTIMSIR